MEDHLIVRLQQANIYQQNKRILTEVNIRISKGEFTYLIGKTGSGKSSLLKTLYAALPLKEGKGTVAGFDLKTLDRKSIPMLRRRLGIVFQDFNLLTDRNVENNLRFVLEATGWDNEKKIRDRCMEVLEQVELKSKAGKMPWELSGGEQQRVVIARALLNNPQLLIADEATGNLDPETSDDILLLVRDISKKNNTAVIFATHDYRVIQHFPARIIRCVDSRVISDEEIEI